MAICGFRLGGMNRKKLSDDRQDNFEDRICWKKNQKQKQDFIPPPKKKIPISERDMTDHPFFESHMYRIHIYTSPRFQLTLNKRQSN